jgi:hypothetical protein
VQTVRNSTFRLERPFYLTSGVPGFARDEKLQKQIFEITWRDKGWIG